MNLQRVDVITAPRATPPVPNMPKANKIKATLKMTKKDRMKTRTITVRLKIMAFEIGAELFTVEIVFLLWT